MSAGHFQEMGIAVGASVAATLVIALFVYWLIKALSGRRHALHHSRRLAAEIVAVAHTIEADLGFLGAEPTALVFRSRCLEQRRRADDALSGSQLDRLSLPEMERWLERLHEDHGRMVDLRSGLDAELAARVRGAPRRAAGARECGPSSKWTPSSCEASSAF